MSQSLIPHETVQEFQEEGAVVIRGLFEPWVQGVREAIEENKRQPSWRERTYRSEDDRSSEFFSGLLCVVLIRWLSRACHRLADGGNRCSIDGIPLGAYFS